MEKFKTIIKNNWIVWIIMLQPILDIVSYFQSKYLQQSFSWIFRMIILAIIFVVTFVSSKNRKKLVLSITPFILFFVLHMANLYRIKELSLILDVKYFILVFQMPILSILLIDYIKSKNNELGRVKKTIACNFFIIATSIFIAYITNTYEYTYTDRGILGWFSGSNTPSMILCALAPWALYYISNNKNIFLYILGSMVIFLTLYTNSTRACYLTLVASFVVVLFSILFLNKESKKIYKVVITAFFILITFFAYRFSATFDKMEVAEQVNKESVEDIKNIISVDNQIEKENIDFNNLDLNDNKLIANILKTSYIYVDVMEIHGEDKVVEAMKEYLSPEALADNRLRKVINAKIEYNESDIITKILGIGYSRIQSNSLDLENDLQAIFYYYGYLGTILYVFFILYYLVRLAILFFRNFSIIRDKEYVILAFLILLLIAGGEYSGAFLRKANANIYLSLYIVLMHFKLENDLKKKVINNKKISFLLLHLGYGGIETSTINTANALSEKFDVELISFYNLKDNQEKLLNKNISIKYLYNCGPNKEEFKHAIKEKNILKILKEGFKAVDILAKKRFLIKYEIQNSNSFAIVSTRYDFSVLLNRYGRKDTIKIAQEHHHHNNNKKYIKTLKLKYKKIDYLFALTNSLKKDYEKFLVKNKHTKIIVVPNMITLNPKQQALLNTNNIITISRLHEGKRINELINIFSKIENKDSKLYIIGSGDEEQNLKHQIYALGLKERVIMTGYLNKDEQTDYLLNSSIFAMTSISEGLPMVLLEAMQFGLPCIAYETDSGVSDIIRNNENGFIVKNRCEKNFIDKINTLLKDYELRKKMSKNCIQTCEKFKKENISKLWFTILNKKS